MTNNVELKTFGVGSVVLSEGAYTKQELQDIIDYFNVMEKRGKELAANAARVSGEVSK